MNFQIFIQNVLVVIHSEIISKFLNNRRSKQHKFENIHTIFGTYLITTHAKMMVLREHQTTYYNLRLFFLEENYF